MPRPQQTATTEQREGTLMANAADQSTLPAVHNGTNAVDLLSRLGQVESDWDDLDDLDLAPEETQIPVIKISRKVDGTGGIKLTGDDDVTESVQFVWAARGVSRVKFAKAYDPKSDVEIDCRSADGKAPAPAQPLWANTKTADGRPDPTAGYDQPASCSVCPHAFENGASGPTACKKSMEALIYLQRPGTSGETIDVARFRFGGLAYKAARLYWDSFRYRIPKRRPVGAITEMTLERETTDNGVFFVPHFEVVTELTRDQANVFIGDARSRATEWQAHIADDLDPPVMDVAADTGDPFADEPQTDPFHGQPNNVGQSGTEYDHDGNPIEDAQIVDPDQPQFDVDIDATNPSRPF